MPKAEKGTPKDIANRAKAKGLCKLKFYCQMCQKQCRDENGFKCHLTSDSHLRQMKIFQDNPDRVMDSFSKEFESSYLETLKRRHSTMKVNANHVYQEVIRERHHIHMNATCWATLSDFVQYLGRVHKCLVEETERGWYVQYIDRDPTLLARQEAARKRAEAERLEEQRHAKRMEEIRRQAVAKENGGVLLQKPTEILPQKSDSAGSQLAPVTVALAPPPPGVLTIGTKKKKSLKTSLWEEDEDENNDENIGEKVDEVLNEEPKRNNNMSSRKRRWDYAAAATTTSQDEPTAAGTENQKQIKESTNPISSSANLKEVRKKYWLYQNIIVRVITKHLANGEYYKRKGKVTKVVDKYTAEVEILDPDGGDILKLDQDDLETVIPKVIGEKVLIVNGKGRGSFAKVVRLDTNRYKADLELLPTGAQERHLIENVDFEDFCKTI